MSVWIGVLVIVVVIVVGASARAGSPAPPPTPASSPTQGSPIAPLADLAGFFAAHAVWSIEDGETLIPIHAFEKIGGERQMNRLAHDQLEEAVAHGKEQLTKNEAGAVRAVLLYDGRITLDTGKIDALIIEAVQYGAERRSFTMAVPYRPAKEKGGFAVYRPKLVAFDGPKEETEVVADLFFQGVDKHGKGSASWNKHLDQSK